MNTKSLFLRYIGLLFMSLIVTSVYLPVHYRKQYPKTLDLQFNPGVKQDYLLAIEQKQPKIVLIGDSTLYDGVDADQLSDLLNINSYSLPVPGSATAAWYLVMKNIVLESSHYPRYIIILFRDTMLTAPYFRTTGRYFELLDDYAQKDEPLLTELIYKNQMSPIEKFSEQYLPLYSVRWEIREEIDNFLKHKIPSIFNCPRACSQKAVASVLGREVDMVAYNQIANDSAAGLYKPEAMDFEKQINRSFLPAMVELANKNKITLIFVRTRNLTYPSSVSEPPMLRKYIKSLDLYLSYNSNVYLFDFSQDPRITDNFFYGMDAIHFNTLGKKEFTKILADEFISRFVK